MLMARDAGWEESKHPRGQPGNAGQFGPGGGGAAAAKKSRVAAREKQHQGIDGLADFMHMVSDFHGGAGKKTPQAFVLKNGYPYVANDKTYQGKRAPMKQCFKNAALDAINNSDRTYVEGYVSVHGVPIEHAWTVDKSGQVYDSTIRPDDAVAGYFGVPFKTDYLLKTLVKNKVYGLLGGMSKSSRSLAAGDDKDFKEEVDVSSLSQEAVSDRLGYADRAARKIPDTSKIDTPERRELRAKIQKQLYEKDIGHRTRNRVVTIITGLPASGKSTLGDPIVKAGALELDPDLAKAELPEYQDGIGAFATHEESSAIARGVMTEALKNGDDIMWPRVDSPDKILKDVANLKRLGYTVHLKHLEVSPETAEKSAVERYLTRGRYVSPLVVREYGNRPRETYEAVKKAGVADSTEMYEREYAPGKAHAPLKKVE